MGFRGVYMNFLKRVFVRIKKVLFSTQHDNRIYLEKKKSDIERDKYRRTQNDLGR